MLICLLLLTIINTANSAIIAPEDALTLGLSKPDVQLTTTVVHTTETVITTNGHDMGSGDVAAKVEDLVAKHAAEIQDVIKEGVVSVPVVVGLPAPKPQVTVEKVVTETVEGLAEPAHVAVDPVPADLHNAQAIIEKVVNGAVEGLAEPVHVAVDPVPVGLPAPKPQVTIEKVEDAAVVGLPAPKPEVHIEPVVATAQ